MIFKDINAVSTSTVIGSNIPIENDSSSDDADPDALLAGTAYNSHIAMAMALVKNNRIQHNLHLRCFTVLDDNKKPFLVTLEPNLSCTCISFTKRQAKCVHILGVKYSLGQDIDSAYKMPTLSSLVRGKAAGKKSGRKRRGLFYIYIPLIFYILLF